ncbi:MAG: arginine N-succinyltransferase, partial [Pseudomonadota bacterium]
MSRHSLTDTRIRPIRQSDSRAFSGFAAMAGHGMTTLPHDADALDRKIERSEASFAGRAQGAEAEYFMVMEEIGSGRLVGCAAVYPCIGSEFGFYSFRRLREHRRSKEFDRVAQSETLH